jgi:thiamine kinase-like enzyme
LVVIEPCPFYGKLLEILKTRNQLMTNILQTARTAEVVTHVLREATGEDPAALKIQRRPVLAYQSNHLYDVWLNGRHLIAKEYLRPDEWDTAPAHEFAALQRVAHLDVAPQPFFYEPTLGPVVVYEYMAGEMWDRQQPSPDQLRQLAGLWAQVNALPTDGLWAARSWSPPELVAWLQERFQVYAEWAAAAFPSAQETAATCQALLESRRDIGRELEALPVVGCFCRSDARFANVIQRPDGRLGLVDWEDSGLLDPAVDLADLVTHPNQEDLFSWEEWQPFLKTYLAQQRHQDPAALAHRMHLYLALFPLFWLALLIKPGMQRAQEGRLDGWLANDMPAQQRLRRYLARALAWPAYNFQSELADLESVRFFPLHQ